MACCGKKAANLSRVNSRIVRQGSRYENQPRQKQIRGCFPKVPVMDIRQERPAHGTNTGQWAASAILCLPDRNKEVEEEGRGRREVLLRLASVPEKKKHSRAGRRISETGREG
jgi:hypothetical protein